MRRVFIAGLVLGVLITGCASFAYKYYGLELVRYEGKLLGVNPADDLSVEVCKPDQFTTGKCVVMIADEFYTMKQDFEDTKMRLQKCEAAHP